MISKKFNRFAMTFAVIVVACMLFLGLFTYTTAPVHAQALTTNLTITYIAVDDQSGNAKTAFTQGDVVTFVMYVNNPSNFPDTVTLQANVKSAGGYTIFNSSPWTVVIPGNSTPGDGWKVAIPNSAPAGITYFRGTATDSQGSVNRFATFTVRNHISYNPYPDSTQCTWKAEDLMHTATGLYMPNFGNAHSWRDNAGPNGWSGGTKPETSSVMVMQYADANGNPYKYFYWNGSQWVQTTISTVGHVGWVTSIGNGGSEVYIVDRNWNLDGKDGGRWIWIVGAPVNFIYSSH